MMSHGMGGGGGRLLEVAVTHCKFYNLLRSDPSLFSSGYVWCLRIDPNVQGNVSRHL